MNDTDNAIIPFVTFLMEGGQPFRSEALRNSEQRVNQVLEAFCFMVANDIPPPPLVMRFIAEGARQKIDGATPWQRDNKRSVEPHVVALVQLINERYPRKQADIAAYAGTSKRTIGDYVTRRGSEIKRHLDLYKIMYREHDMSRLLDALAELAGVDTSK